MSGYDAGKKIKGRKRHITVDTQGNFLAAQVHCAGVQDRDGAPGLIADTLDSFANVGTIFANCGYASDKLHYAVLNLEQNPTIQIVRCPNRVNGFVVIARRWVVERTFAWLGRCRRLAKDLERATASSEVWLLIAAIRRALDSSPSTKLLVTSFESDSQGLGMSAAYCSVPLCGLV